jgi:hypothetical protein
VTPVTETTTTESVVVAPASDSGVTTVDSDLVDDDLLDDGTQRRDGGSTL